MRGVKWERIVRVLLNDPDGSLTKYRVAKLAGSSIGWTMEYLGKLEGEGFTEGTMVIDYRGLLEHWAENAKRVPHLDFFLASPRDVLGTTELEHALTTYIAENALNHYLFPHRWDLYVRREDVPLWKAIISREGLVGAGNVRLLLHDEHAMYRRQRLDGLWIASLPQVMVDLKREGGVCGEAYGMMVERYVPGP